MRREKEHASDSADQLRLQLQQARESISVADDKLNTTVKEKVSLELKVASTSKTYKELSELYEQHLIHTEKNTAQLEAKLTSMREERDTLESNKQQLERQLKDEKELRIEYHNQLTRSKMDPINKRINLPQVNF